MALTGIQIFKLLPKTNCGECGVPTCLAFAMNLAAGKAELDACPYVSEEAREQLAEASAPPIRPLTVGVGDTAVKIGGETVLFRHEKTFFNPPGIAGRVADDDADIAGKVKKWTEFQYERVGLNLRPELVFVECVSGDAGKFEAAVKAVVDNSDLSLILCCEDPEVMAPVAAAFKDKNPLLYAATGANADKMSAIAGEHGLPLAIRAVDIDEAIELSDELTDAGHKDLVIDSGARDLAGAFQDQIALRRSALLEQNRTLGFPTICFANAMGETLDEQVAAAAMLVAKYAGIIVLDDLTSEVVFPLLLERLNIYTDPQRPMTVTEGIYEVGGPNADSPLLITTNFSLTYFIVSGEIEGSRVPSWLLIKDTEGLSVMTAWAAGKFSGDDVGMFVKKIGVEEKVSHKSLVIPGYAAAIAGDVEEELPGWNIQVGPREAAHLTKFLKEWTPDK
ncbi:MAG: acetyl-CoA decarbonylase/synthase complex subunit gamma [Desulfarculaceae bacterium]|nr:acetyl-CoA decarbonylase/synthase complex subunit gamma [Desulfarculaceae bacterium]MCF8073668.1 acetyl-CoA decarbonylase/synthase complex subunit gamma [Desulfarculaceae bacterium]MCF8101909.1 acetyl-CoA decarbonylase/synthase complex subunit gamma [Desulfarculaceae bacterium]MCF8117668.1 acetyl-CoA decarbonylase/synthase complex subunit gamma [Desulfarculaceae bacterium]